MQDLRHRLRCRALGAAAASFALLLATQAATGMFAGTYAASAVPLHRASEVNLAFRYAR